MKINIVTKEWFNVLFKGHIFACVSDNNTGWYIYEIFVFLDKSYLCLYHCNSRYDCLRCLMYFYRDEE